MASLNPVEDIQNKSRVCGYCVPYDQGEGIESPLHEDTDDIDALMSTEEELSSTCHTLSELNVDNSSMPTDDGDDQSSSNARKRRRIQKSDVEEVADREFVHSNAESSQKIMSRKKHVWKGTFQDKRGKYEQNTEFLEDAWFVKRAKLIKVKDTFEELKNVIPGGDCLDDTASVLEKAVYYIKSLKAKLQKLDTSNEILVNVH